MRPASGSIIQIIQIVKEEGRGIREAVDAIEDPSVTGQQGPAVFDPQIPFDG